MFAEISLRALLGIHHNYLSWSIEQTWSEEMKAAALNRGPGVALADELTVCAAISQEFLASRFPAGRFVGGNELFNIEAGQRYYRLTREVCYPKNPKLRCDFCIERVHRDVAAPRSQTLVEAKRAYLWKTKLDGTVERAVNQIAEVRNDIRKITKQEAQFATPAEAPRGYLLVWNVTDKERGTDIGPEDYAKEMARGVEHFTVWQIKVAPLSAKLPCEGGLGDWKVENWLWLILAEVTQQEQGSLRKEGGSISKPKRLRSERLQPPTQRR